VTLPTPPQKSQPRQLVIKLLGNIVAEKRARFHQLGMMNAHGLDEPTRMQRSIEYSQAQSALWNAERDLERALLNQSGDHP